MPVDPVAASGFTAAQAYERGRPGYPADAVRMVVSELRLDRSSRLLDLAAGTGQLSRLFAPRVGSVVAVEPSEAMRRELARRVPAAELLAGEAEALPLADGSVDAIVVGEAFHWFAREPALHEMARVLAPGGGLALLWNVPVGADPSWPAQLVELVRSHRASTVPAAQRYGPQTLRVFEHGEHFAPLSCASTEHAQRLDREAMVAQVASYSYIASLPEPERAATLEQVRQLAPDTCTLTLRTDVHWTRKLAGAGAVAG